MSTWPSVLSTISDPTATNKLNSPSHSSIEQAQNDGVKKLETFIGTLASAQGTLMYDVRAAASDGGGHVQAANKGGTGQTSFAKGDLLVATSSSVISKLVVGTNNQVLTADSDQASGVKWAGVANAANIQNQTYTYARASVMSGSVFGVKLSENPSILSDGLGLVVKFPAAPTSSVMALQVFTSSSGSVAARIKKTNLANPDTTDITASMIGVLEFDSVSSVFQIMNPREFSTNKTVLIDNVATNYVNSNANDTNWYSESIPASTLGTTGGIFAKIFFRAVASANTYDGLTFRLKYGSNTIASSSMMAAAAFNVNNLYGYAEVLITSNAATNSQIGSFKLLGSTDNSGGAPVNFLSAGGQGTSSVESTANQNLVLSIQANVGDSTVSFLGYHCAITKI